MKIITLWRPWGAAIALGLKTIETRGHDRFRGLAGERIGIHNAQKWDRDGFATMWRYAKSSSMLRVADRGDVLNTPGAIIATVCVEEFGQLDPVLHTREALCPITDNFFGLFLIDVNILKSPIVMPGAMGIWTWGRPHDDRGDLP